MLEQKEEEKSSSVPNSNNSSVDRFINEYNVEIGTDKIPNYLIFYTYRVLWDGQHKSNKVNKIVFFRAFNKKFTQVRTGKQRYYLLDANCFDMGRENVERAKLYEKTEKARKETIKTRKRRLSLSKKESKSKE